MRVLVTGGTGYVGRFVVENLLAAGDEPILAGRTQPADDLFSAPAAFRPLDLEPTADHAALLEGIDHLVHCAFHHAPGKYRGGEGSGPETFRRLNRDGSIALFEAARVAGVRRAVFLSTRAVYGAHPPGTSLTEQTECRPDMLYGTVKLDVERAVAALAAPGFVTASLRVTGVYGAHRPGGAHKWDGLFADYLAGKAIEPRVATEVHGSDVASAVRLMLTAPADQVSGRIFNVSDLLLDRHDLLAILRNVCPDAPEPPAKADAGKVNVMETGKLQALGWQPGGRERLEETVAETATCPRYSGSAVSPLPGRG